MTSLKSNIEILTRDFGALITITYEKKAGWLVLASLPPRPSSQPVFIPEHGRTATSNPEPEKIIRQGRGLGNMLFSIVRELTDDPTPCTCTAKIAKRIRPQDPNSPLRCTTCGGRIPTPKTRGEAPRLPERL